MKLLEVRQSFDNDLILINNARDELNKIEAPYLGVVDSKDELVTLERFMDTKYIDFKFQTLRRQLRLFLSRKTYEPSPYIQFLDRYQIQLHPQLV